jgi:CDP-glucose 4,6-dehydratase
MLAQAVYDGKFYGEAFNFSPERAVSVLELVAIMQKQMNCMHLKPIIENNAVGEIHSQYLDATKATENLEWQPSFSLEDGLRETIDWYSNFFDFTKELTKVTGR